MMFSKKKIGGPVYPETFASRKSNWSTDDCSYFWQSHRGRTSMQPAAHR